MSPLPERAMNAIVANEGVHRAVKRVHVTGTLLVLLLVVLLAVAGVGLLVRTYRPVPGGTGPIMLAGVVALIAFICVIVLVSWLGRSAQQAGDLAAAVNSYLSGCLLSAALAVLSWLVSLYVLFVNGISGTKWVLMLVVFALNTLAAILALPRVKHLRRLYYSPTLPFQRTQ